MLNIKHYAVSYTFFPGGGVSPLGLDLLIHREWEGQRTGTQSKMRESRIMSDTLVEKRNTSREKE